MKNLISYCVHRYLVEQLHITCLTRKGGEVDEYGFRFWTVRRAIDAMATMGLELTVPANVCPNRGPVLIEVKDHGYHIAMPRDRDDKAAEFESHGWSKGRCWNLHWNPNLNEGRAVGRFMRFVRYHVEPLGDRWATKDSLVGSGCEGWSDSSRTATGTLLRMATSKPIFRGGPRTKAIPDAALNDLFEILRSEYGSSLS